MSLSAQSLPLVSTLHQLVTHIHQGLPRASRRSQPRRRNNPSLRSQSSMRSQRRHSHKALQRIMKCQPRPIQQFLHQESPASLSNLGRRVNHILQIHNRLTRLAPAIAHTMGPQMRAILAAVSLPIRPTAIIPRAQATASQQAR